MQQRSEKDVRKRKRTNEDENMAIPQGRELEDGCQSGRRHGV